MMGHTKYILHHILAVPVMALYMCGLVWLVSTAFLGQILIPVVFLDAGYNFYLSLFLYNAVGILGLCIVYYIEEINAYKLDIIISSAVQLLVIYIPVCGYTGII